MTVRDITIQRGKQHVEFDTLGFAGTEQEGDQTRTQCMHAYTESRDKALIRLEWSNRSGLHARRL